MHPNIQNNILLSRFEMSISNVIAFINYEKDDNVIYLTHAEVPEIFRNRGYGSIMIKFVLDLLLKDNYVIVAECPAVKKFVLTNNDYDKVIVD